MMTLPTTCSKGLSEGLYIGLMSGTSLDAVDGVLLDCSASSFKIISRATCPMPRNLREIFLNLQHPSANELHEEAIAANALARLYADCVKAVLASTSIEVSQVCALGAHGQTIRHQPGLYDGIGYTCQVLAPALLAELSGINVITDFRSRDLAAGGQGAPLVPAFHTQAFASETEARVICNIGGVANLTILPVGCTQNASEVLGFDCGPGNLLLDHCAQIYLGKEYDDKGQWAAQGQIEPLFLAQLMQDDFFCKVPPKSTGRDLFNRTWLDQHYHLYQSQHDRLDPVDIQATLTACTAHSIAKAARDYGRAARTLVLCGGGARNLYLVKLIKQALPQWRVLLTDDLGMPAQDVEAAAFAWLAWRFMHGLAGNLPAVTGAHSSRVLGAYYPR